MRILDTYKACCLIGLENMQKNGIYGLNLLLNEMLCLQAVWKSQLEQIRGLVKKNHIVIQDIQRKQLIWYSDKNRKMKNDY